MEIREPKASERALFNSVVTHPLQSWEWGEFREKTGVKVIRRLFYSSSERSESRSNKNSYRLASRQGGQARTIVDPNRIGMWGHSLGGFITLRAMVVSKDIKAGVIWAGVVANYDDLINNWRRPIPSSVPSGARRWRQALIDEFGTPKENPEFWKLLSANSFLKDISGPVQLHHGTADASVPIEFSRTLEKQLKEAGKTVELYEYPGDDHNIAANFNIAVERSVEFFNKYLR